MEKLPLSSDRPKVHFIGVGGIGVSALARFFKNKGFEVSGSDSAYSSTINELRMEGVKIHKGHRGGNIPANTGLVVYSAAIPSSNAEIKKARRLGIYTRSYAEALGEITKNYKTIAVAGAHGKSTSAALLSLALIKSGFDPSAIIGTKIKEFRNSNFHPGKSNYLVLEADEYHKSFLNYSPYAVLITNLDREHLDFYKNLGEIKKTFLKFMENIKAGGILAVNKDDKNLFSLKKKIRKIAKKNNLRLYWYGFRAVPRLVGAVMRVLKIPGRHNISNALGVYTLARALGARDKDILKAFSSYRGAWRRMEYRGKLEIKNPKIKAEVYDDYAHHPAEIQATLLGIRQKWPKTPLICVFQPHQAKRLAALFPEFTGSFDAADALILLPIYKVAGRDKSISRADSQTLAKAVQKRIEHIKSRTLNLKSAVYLPRPEKLRGAIKKIIRNHLRSFADLRCIVVMMGAGDIYNFTSKLIKSS